MLFVVLTILSVFEWFGYKQLIAIVHQCWAIAHFHDTNPCSMVLIGEAINQSFRWNFVHFNICIRRQPSSLYHNVDKCLFKKSKNCFDFVLTLLTVTLQHTMCAVCGCRVDRYTQYFLYIKIDKVKVVYIM